MVAWADRAGVYCVSDGIDLWAVVASAEGLMAAELSYLTFNHPGYVVWLRM